MAENRIREMRTKFRMTQERLSESIGGHGKVVMSLIENGYVMPTREMLEGLCKTFRCNPNDLYDEHDLNLSSAPDEKQTISIDKGEYESMKAQAKSAGFDSVESWFEFSRQTLNILFRCAYGRK